MGSKPSSAAEKAWRKRLAEFRRSNLSVSEFCQQIGVSTPSFYVWRKRLERDQLDSSPTRPSGKATARSTDANPFVAVNLPAPAWTEVEFPNGVRIRVPALNAEALRIALLAGIQFCQEAS